jgi:hypothetical protein
MEKQDIQDDQLVDTIFAATYLGVNPSVLRTWRQRGIGPAYIFICPHGKTRTLVRYRLSDLQSSHSQIRIETNRLPLAKMDRTIQWSAEDKERAREEARARIREDARRVEAQKARRRQQWAEKHARA